MRDKATNKSQGFCFLKYEDQRSTILAVDNFNGMTLLKRTIRVDHVENYKLPKEIREKEANLLEENPDRDVSIGPGHAYKDKNLENDFDISKGVDLWADSNLKKQRSYSSESDYSEIKKKKEKKSKKSKSRSRSRSKNRKHHYDNHQSINKKRTHEDSSQKISKNIGENRDVYYEKRAVKDYSRSRSRSRDRYNDRDRKRDSRERDRKRDSRDRDRKRDLSRERDRYNNKDKKKDDRDRNNKRVHETTREKDNEFNKYNDKKEFEPGSRKDRGFEESLNNDINSKPSLEPSSSICGNIFYTYTYIYFIYLISY